MENNYIVAKQILLPQFNIFLYLTKDILLSLL